MRRVIVRPPFLRRERTAARPAPWSIFKIYHPGLGLVIAPRCRMRLQKVKHAR